jgi:hypothetical protein
MNTFTFILSAVVLLAMAAPSRAVQTRGGRESSPVKEPNRPPHVGSKGTHPTRPRGSGNSAAGTGGGDRKSTPSTAAFSIRITPADSIIRLQGVEYRAENGVFARGGLAPGKYTIVIHRDGYRDKDYGISLGPGDDTPLSVSLEPLSGILNVAPLIAETEIDIIETATNKHVGVYSGQARRVALPPGRYQVFISKEGYKTTVREVAIEPAANVYLEPTLAPLPRPAAAPPFRRDYATQTQISQEGKFVVVTLTGRSGDTINALGAINITLSAGGGRAQITNVSGMLTGYPCQADFVRLENVAEYSFVEPPGTANQWARAVVRVRPKDSKRPIHFLINWKNLRNTVSDGSPTN